LFNEIIKRIDCIIAVVICEPHVTDGAHVSNGPDEDRQLIVEEARIDRFFDGAQ
jgi:hypothetical protein